jgi:hypothetical protein
MRYAASVFLVLLGTTFSMAQGSGNANPATPTESTESQTRSGAALNRDMTVKGCLGGSEGSYTLTDSHGTVYQLSGDTSKLSDHVGHEVKITGPVKTPTAGTEASAGTSENPGSQPISVTSVKHIAKTCSNTRSMSK